MSKKSVILAAKQGQGREQKKIFPIRSRNVVENKGKQDKKSVENAEIYGKSAPANTQTAEIAPIIRTFRPARADWPLATAEFTTSPGWPIMAGSGVVKILPIG